MNELFEYLNRLDRAASLAPLHRADHVEVQLCSQRLRDGIVSLNARIEELTKAVAEASQTERPTKLHGAKDKMRG